MLLNYHEMTMNEPRNSRAKKAQFTVICSIMIGIVSHSLITSGALSSVEITEGIFPGGDYVYRLNQRDYAAAFGLIDVLAEDIHVPSDSFGDLMYTLYLDNPFLQSGPKQRFAVGILDVNHQQPTKQYKEQLLNRNIEIAKMPTMDETSEENTHLAKFQRQEWSTVDLPSVDSAVVQFPCTNGFVSILVTSYKIIPALRKYAKEKGEKGNVPVVISTCSPKQFMCTHYAPLLQGDAFLLGLPDSQTFTPAAPYDFSIDWGGILKDMKRVIPPLRLLLG